MSNGLLHCPKCQATLLTHSFNRSEFVPCGACGSALEIEIFPALFRRTEAGRTGETVMMDGEASCFYHPAKKAVLPCESCGRFLCALCDCEHQGQHLCPSCLEAGRSKGKIKSLENKRTRYDNMAFLIALLGFVPPIIYLSFVTAPIVIYLSIRYWKAPLGLTQRSRIKLLLAAFIALLQVAGWIALVIAVFTR